MRTLDSFFKKRPSQDSARSSIPETENPPFNSSNISEVSIQSNAQESSRKVQRISQDSNSPYIERDPRLRKSIWNYPPEKRDEIRRVYLNLGPFQLIPEKFSKYIDKNGRRFIPAWYKLFPDWLEFSPIENAVYFLPCFLFIKTSSHYGANAFILDGFRSWKKVNGKNCAFRLHEGDCPNSSHKIAVRSAHELMNPLQHIEKIIDKQSSEMVARNRLRLKVSIDVVRLCALQGIAFRGHNKHSDSDNRGNVLEIIKHTTGYNKEVSSVVLENTPHNASYTSPQIQKEILSLYARRIRKYIRDEIGDAKIAILMDESRDEAKREQMAIVLRFVDKSGFIRERFFDIIHVEDTKACTLKKEISSVLSRNNLLIQNIRGQGYDGASNMRGEWNGLQALILNECPYAYYVHCFAHRLQLILVASAQSVIPIEHFFDHLTVIVNLVDSSSKRHDQLQNAHAIQLAELVSTNELDIGRGQNQIGTIQRPGDTRWGSHLRSLLSLLNMYDAVLLTLSEIVNDKTSLCPRAAADGAYDIMTSFEFVFILHLLVELLQISNDLCQILQYKSQDIVNAMDAVEHTKELIQRFRENGWEGLFDKVKTFCEKRDIDIPDMTSLRRSRRGRLKKNNPITLSHHYRIDIFTSTIDSILQEMNRRFDEKAIELLRLSSALDPRNGYESFDIDNICKLVEKFYPDDFRLSRGDAHEIPVGAFRT